MTTAVEAVPLAAEDVDDAARVLVRAFADDPIARFVVPGATDWSRVGPSLATTVVRFARRWGRPLVTADGVRGVALWFPPEPGEEPSLWELVGAGLLTVPFRLGLGATNRAVRLVSHVERHHATLAPGPHWYLAILATDPDHQRQGIGRALMAPVLATADRDRHACYLESATAANTRYYERHGFRVVGESDVPDSDLHVWMMRRDPV